MGPRSAFAIAAERWPRDGPPQHPWHGWSRPRATAPFAVPADRLLPDRLAAVLAVVYLIFNQGYTDRADLAAEAIRLGRLLAELMADESEVYGLLALMLLHDSRREARVVDGQLIPLAEQDRSRHDSSKVQAGRAALARGPAPAGPTRNARRPRHRR